MISLSTNSQVTCVKSTAQWYGRRDAHTCVISVALMVQGRVMRMKTGYEIWCNGSGDLQPLLDWHAEHTLSPAFIPDCRPQDFLKPYLSQDTCCVNHELLNVLDDTDAVQVFLFTPQAILFRSSLGNSWQGHRQRSHLAPTQCSKVHVFMMPVILPPGLALGFES